MGAEISKFSYNAFFYFKYRIFIDPALGGDKKENTRN
jgi:hypothetical protein